MVDKIPAGRRRKLPLRSAGRRKKCKNDAMPKNVHLYAYYGVLWTMASPIDLAMSKMEMANRKTATNKLAKLVEKGWPR